MNLSVHYSEMKGMIVLKDNRYIEYKKNDFLRESFGEDTVPLLLMQLLRQMDFPITRGISYERTVDDFLTQLAVNDVLRPLRKQQNLVILLDMQGALIRSEGAWELLFTPGIGEQQTLEGDEDLLPILNLLLESEKEGNVQRVKIPERNQKTLVAGLAPFSILDEYCKKQNGGYLSVAQKIVIAGIEELYAHVPFCRYGQLTTVDKDEIENYSTIKLLLDDYIYRYDHSEGTDMPRPLSIAIFGAPGSGKSFGVKQIAKSCGRFIISAINLSQLNSPMELFESLHEALQRGKDEIPLVFFDEFDAELSGTPLGWLKYFLAPMQDGEYTVNGKHFQVNGAVFAFAGATASSFPEFIPTDEENIAAFKAVKGTDFASRLKGILNIKGPNPNTVTDRSHIIRRAILMRSQLTHKISRIYDEESGVVHISRALLAALLTVSEYRHGSRSLEFILDMSRLSEVSRFTSSCLPIAEQMDLHLDVDDFQNRLAFEQIIGDAVDTYASAAHKKRRQQRIAELSQDDGTDPEQLLAKEPDMAEWEKLDEADRNSYRSQLRYIGVRLQAYDSIIGIRPILGNDSDTIRDLYGPVLEMLAEMDHDRWMHDKLEDGWKHGILDFAMKTTPELVPYRELDEPVKEQIRLSVRNLPMYLSEIGYELYRKSF